jgi:hypothetical protein
MLIWLNRSKILLELTKKLTKEEVNKSVKAAMNEKIDPELVEICKKLELN